MSPTRGTSVQARQPRPVRESTLLQPKLPVMPRHSRADPDVRAFEPIIEDAIRAFGSQLDYGTDMAAKAYVILTKRTTWRARDQVREGEKIARQACATAGTFTCAATAPCGSTTQCRYSTGQLRDLEVPSVPLAPARGGKLVQRPQPGPDGEPTSYNSEAAVLVLRELLEVLPRLA